ncbi:fatty acid desaturase, partial [Nymphaea thermarum]
YPLGIEILCHDINVHIPHHISPRIPNYNLRAAHQSLKEKWGTRRLVSLPMNPQLFLQMSAWALNFNMSRLQDPLSQLREMDQQKCHGSGSEQKSWRRCTLFCD